MSTGELTDDSKPRYILAQKGIKVMEKELKRITEVCCFSFCLRHQIVFVCMIATLCIVSLFIDLLMATRLTS